MPGQETEGLAAITEEELLKMKAEIAELKSRETEYMKTIKEQGQELESLHRLARVVLTHFEDFLITGCHVDRCVACGKCDYEVLGQAIMPWKDALNK